MPKQSTLPPDSREDQDLRYDPAQAEYERRFNDIRFNEMVSHPDLDDLRQSEQDAAAQPTASNAGIHKNIADAENHPTKNAINNPMNYDSKQNASKVTKGNSSFWKNRKLLAGLGIGGITGGIIAMFLLMLPLKLNALITNATQAAERIPGYAVQHRTEYLMTRILATRMLQLSYSLDDKDIEPVFCKERGNVGCSLLATYTAQRISDTMGLDMIKLPNQTVRVTINAKGRDSLGGYARSWEIKLTRDWGESGVLNTVKKIETHEGMRAYLKAKVDKNYKNTLSRFVARRILMLKYGVRSWRAFEATRERIDNKIADVKTAFKVGMYQNTIGKISPRFAAYIACLQGGTATCEDLLKNLSSAIEPPGDGPKAGETEAEYERRKKQYESLEKIGARVRGEIPDVPDGDMLAKGFAKIFSTKVLAAATGVVSIVVITDTVMKAVDSVNNGLLDTIGFDMAAQAYTGFAFGDSTGVVPNWEKVKVGDIEGTDAAEVMNELGSLIDCDGSALCAYENGYGSASLAASIAPIAGAATGGFARECETDEGIKQITLSPGELVCPERKLYRNYAGLLVDNEWFKPLAAIAGVWESSLGQIMNWINGAIGTLVGWITTPFIALLKPVTDAIGKQLEPLINWFMETVFNPPSVGYDTTPANNYDALSGALHLEQWEMMKNGIVDGVVLGGGGQYLTEAESQEILAYQKSEEQDNFNSQSNLARLFDTSLKGSLAQQAVLQAPTNLTSLAKFPTKVLASLFHAPTASAASAATSSPFGLPNYSYKLNDSALTADPNTYTETYCSDSAIAREASLVPPDQTDATVPVYTKTDPCALEKLVVGSLITPDNPTDPNAFPPISGTLSGGSTAEGECYDGTNLLGTYDQAHDDGKKISINLCELTSIDLQPGFYTDQDPQIFRSGSGGVVVGASVSEQFQKLGEDALAEKPPRQLVGKGVRSYEKQEYFYNCYITKKCNDGNLAAPPGTSNHENGTAIDFVLGPGDLAWLRANGSRHDLKELTGGKQPEPWHWSP